MKAPNEVIAAYRDKDMLLIPVSLMMLIRSLMSIALNPINATNVIKKNNPHQGIDRQY